jgi:hypothetical protein
MFKELSPLDRHSLNRALPFSLTHPPRFRSFMPTGRCHCVRSPARKSKSEEVGEKKEKKGKRK